MNWNMTPYRERIVGLLLFVAVSVSCSTPQLNPESELVVSDQPMIIYTLLAPVTIESQNARDTILKEGTRWNKVGELIEGTVYSTKDQVVIVNSFNVHEGYIVVKDSSVVGYYLPVDKTYVKTTPVIINFNL